MTDLTILYGTQTGNAERIALRLARYALLGDGGRRISVHAADDVPPDSWVARQRILFVCSNANQGDPPLSIRRTWDMLLAPSASASELAGLAFAVFGVGDSLYEKFNYMGKKLHNRLVQLGATPLVHRGLGDESDPRGVEEVLEPFVSALWGALGWGRIAPTLHSLAAKELPLFPLFRVSFTAPGEEYGDNGGACVRGGGDDLRFACEVVNNRRLTSADHFQAVHHIELRSADNVFASFQPGDALGIFVDNHPEQVQRVLDALGYSGSESVRLFPAKRCCESAEVLLDDLPAWDALKLQHPLPLRRVLATFFDLEAVVPQDFLWMLSRMVEGSGEEAEECRERLLELSDPGRQAEYLSYAHREKRNVVEVLYDFKHYFMHMDLAMFLSFAPMMRPRYYSISSSPALDGHDVCHLTVAELAWTTPMGRDRLGLCSSALTRSSLGSRFDCCRLEGAMVLPDVPLPLLCVATGSGVAPIRSLLREWAAKARADPRIAQSPVYLFFGCRNAAKDFLYEEEWKALQSGPLSQLRVIPAFSRDTPSKIYVQNQLAQHAQLVGSLFALTAPPPVLYLCGNAKQMPKDVQAALHRIVAATCCDGDVEAGQQILKKMVSEGRYQVDTWSS